MKIYVDRKSEFSSQLLLTVISLVIVGITGCATQPLSAEEKAVRILKKSDAGSSCKEIGKVISGGYAAFTDEGREDNLKRETHKIGGDTVTLDSVDGYKSLNGTAFKCGHP